MKFVFIIPDSPFLIDEKVFPFLGPLYLSAVLKKEGHEVKVIDLVAGQEIPQIEADYVGITATTPQFPRAVEINYALKLRNPEQKVIIGGPHASANPEECERHFDLVCIGEGERFVQLIESRIKVFHRESLPYIDDLDDIPFPDWDAIDLSQYHYTIDGKRTMNILTSRGCPYACSFCLPKGTLILNADLEWIPIENLKTGDTLIGTQRGKTGKKTEFKSSKVLETFHRESNLLEIETTHGTVKSSPEHPWLTTHSRWRRADQLKVGQYLRWVSTPVKSNLNDSVDYMKGYIAGVIESDGCLKRYQFILKENGREYTVHRFRLVGDDEMDDTFLKFCRYFGIHVHEEKFNSGKNSPYKVTRSIATGRRDDFEELEAIVNGDDSNKEFKRGFLGGFFDGDGSWTSAPRFHNKDEELNKRVERYLQDLGFKTVRDVNKPSVRVFGGDSEYIRLMSIIRPRVTHKRRLIGRHLHCRAKILSIKYHAENVEVYNIETETHDFVADGFVTHNCCKAPWGQRIRYRSAENVIEEIGLLRARGYEGLMLYDDEFFLNKERDIEIIEALGAAGMVWRCFSRADVIMRHTDLIESAAANGLKEMLIGCESGSNEILHNINKGTKTWMNEEAIDFLKSLKVRVKAALIIGLPGETPDSIKATERFVERVKPDSVDFTVLRVMPGSNIWKHPENYDLKFSPEYKPYKTKPGEYEAGVSTSNMTAKEIVEARDYLDRKFNPQLWRK